MKKRIALGAALLVILFTLNGCSLWVLPVVFDEMGDLALDAWLIGHCRKTGPAQNAPVPPASPRWAVTLSSGPDSSALLSTAAGSDGVYAAGYIVGDAPYTFGAAGVVTGGFPGGSNAVLVKYSRDGTAQWASTAVTGPGESCFYAVVVGSDGIYVTGSIQGSGVYSFGNGISVAGAYAHGPNMVLVKYNASGTPLWARSVCGAPDATAGYSLAVAGDGIVTAGYLTGNGAYEVSNAVTVTGAGSGVNAVILYYDRNGTAKWARSVVTGPDHSCFYAVAANAGGIYAAGYIDGNGTYSFGAGAPAIGSNARGSNAVIVKYEPGGAPVWARATASGPDESAFQSLALGADGLYAAGFILGDGTYDFGSGVTVAGGGCRNNALLVKYDTAGTARWARSVTDGPDDSSFLSVHIASDSVYASGCIAGNKPFAFGNSIVLSGVYEGGNNAALLKYSTGGTPLWAQSVSAGSQETILSSVTTESGGVFTAGSMVGATPYVFGTAPPLTGPYISGRNIVLVAY